MLEEKAARFSSHSSISGSAYVSYHGSDMVVSIGIRDREKDSRGPFTVGRGQSVISVSIFI